jgi:2-polyprenyl-3-methyl-5-hydroxy-6-metoxy-1,4-benzoquinol methylase
MTGDIAQPASFRRLEVSIGEAPPEAAVMCRIEPEGLAGAPCAPFALPFADGAFSEVRARHVVQYFGKAEAVRFLRECWRVLAPGGSIYLVAPNLDFYLDRYHAGNQHALAGLWGDQDAPGRAHRWGYTRQSLSDLVLEAGFVHPQDLTAAPTSLERDQRHLEAAARKHIPRTAGDAAGSIAQGRQVGTSVDDIRSDHVERYHFAAQFVRSGDAVLDLACGVGYGAYLLATTTDCARVIALDIDADAVAFAQANFAQEKITFRQGDVLDEALPLEPADCVVAFEVLEHIPHDLQFLARIRRLLKPAGTLLISSPNEDLVPHSPTSPYHVRHHTSAELRDVLARAGLRVASESSQDAFEVVPGFGRRFNIAVCRRDDAPATEQFRMPRVESPNPDLIDPRDRTIGLLLGACHAYLARHRALRQQGQALQQQGEALRQQGEALRGQRDAARADIERLREGVAQVRALADKLRAERDDLRGELERHAEALRRLRANPLVRLARGLNRLFGRR